MGVGTESVCWRMCVIGRISETKDLDLLLTRTPNARVHHLNIRDPILTNRFLQPCLHLIKGNVVDTILPLDTVMHLLAGMTWKVFQLEDALFVLCTLLLALYTRVLHVRRQLEFLVGPK